MPTIAAVLVRVVAAHEVRIALADCVQVRVVAEAEDSQRAMFVLAEGRRSGALADMPEPSGDRLKRIGVVAPLRRRICAVRGEAPTRPVPARERMLRLRNLLWAHAFEEIVSRIMLANMVEAQETPASRPVEIRSRQRRLIFARLGATRDGAPRSRPFDPPVHPCLFRCH